MNISIVVRTTTGFAEVTPDEVKQAYNLVLEHEARQAEREAARKQEEAKKIAAKKEADAREAFKKTPAFLHGAVRGGVVMPYMLLNRRTVREALRSADDYAKHSGREVLLTIRPDGSLGYDAAERLLGRISTRREPFTLNVPEPQFDPQVWGLDRG